MPKGGRSMSIEEMYEPEVTIELPQCQLCGCIISVEEDEKNAGLCNPCAASVREKFRGCA